MPRSRPIQNPHSQKTKNMRPSILGQAYRSVKRPDPETPPSLGKEAGDEPLTEVDEDAMLFKSPWFRRVLRRIKKVAIDGKTK